MNKTLVRLLCDYGNIHVYSTCTKVIYDVLYNVHTVHNVLNDATLQYMTTVHVWHNDIFSHFIDHCP